MKLRKPKAKGKLSWILCCVSAIGVIATAYTAAKVTPSAVEKIRSDSMENHEGDPDGYTKTEALASCWRFYILPVSIGVGTVICIFGTNVLNKKQQASLISSYAALSRSFTAYKSKVKDIYGEEAHNKIIDEIMKDVEKADPDVIFSNNFMSCESLDFGAEPDEVPHLFYEAFTNKYFESTISNVLKAEYHLNRNYLLAGYVTVNDYLEFLGLESISNGGNIGWGMDDGLIWIDFDHHINHLDDGLEVYTIDISFSPMPIDNYYL